MSEEKPTFKVTDRRLFNPDGTPREGVERAEEPTPPAPPAEPQRQQAAPAAKAPADDAVESSPGAATAQREREAGPAAETAQEFLMLVEFVASFAADAMGMVPHPGAPAQEEVNLPLARQCIDMLGALRQKTDGRLSAEEQRFLDTLLSQLRMQYVSLTGTQRGGPQQQRAGGFSGGDITGGR